MLSNYNNNIFNIETKNIDGEIYYKARNICDYLNIKNITEATNQIDDEDKKLISVESKSGRKYIIYVTFAGAMFIVCNSRKTQARTLKKWFVDSLKLSYSNETKPSEQIKIMNEYDLHCAVVKFLRSEYKDIAHFTASLGENQTTPDLRIKSFYQGYTRGAADLLILNPNRDYNSFVIEFKTPKHDNFITSESQNVFLQKSILNNQKVLLSNNYNNIIKEIIYYFLSVRLFCYYCKRKFISESSLNKHYKYFHKKSNLLKIKL